MNKVEKSLDTWEKVIVDFFENRISETKLFKARGFIEKKEKEIESEKDPAKRNRQIISRDKKIADLIELRKKAPATEIRSWIDKNAGQSGSIVKASHVLKFSHGSSSPEGLVLHTGCFSALLSTASFKKELVFDLAHSNGNLISVSRFLALTLDKKKIIDLIHDDVFSFLMPFKKDSTQLNNWKEGFASLVERRAIRTGEKTKQIYFPNKGDPVSDKDDYDLLIPLFSSSLAEEIYSWVTEIKFGEEQKKITASKKPSGSDIKTSKYHDGTAIAIPDLGVIKFGGRQPQNISMLNKGRSWKADKKDKTTWGITYLAPTAPPTWQSQLKPPANRQSLFDGFYNSLIKTEVDYLREFLLRFNRLDLCT